jgi:flavin reductase (DIM6/NTAB) family NADH-FMN oxidoreductase RutF
MGKEWQQAFGKMVYGIYVLTTARGDEVNGMIASWVSQVITGMVIIVSDDDAANLLPGIGFLIIGDDVIAEVFKIWTGREA